jgi:flagellin
MRIQHNIAALNSHRQLGVNNNAVSKNLEKLSSGYRINRAGDDAAGLAISEKMRAQIKGLETASKNANDGISLVQTAEGALTEVHSMLNRMTELATQSANGTYDNDVDRANLQKEVESLQAEVDRISESTNYNGINLLDGSLAGGGSTGTALTGAQVVTYKAATIDDTVALNSTSGATLGVEKLNVDGAEIEVDWTKLSTEDQAALTKDWTVDDATGPSKADAEKAASIMEKAINDAIDASGLGVEHITVKATGDDAAADTFTIKSGTADGSSTLGVLTDGGLVQTLTGITAHTEAASSLVEATATPSNADDMDGTFNMSIDGKDYAITTGAISTTGTGAATDVEVALKTAIDAVITNYNAAVPADEALNTDDFGVSITKDGRVEVTNNSDVNIGFSDLEGEGVAAAIGISTEGKLAGNGLKLQVGDTAEDFNKVTVSVGNMSSSALGIGNITIAKQENASEAIDKIKSAINTVSSTRGDLGAVQNRLEHTINNLGVATENMTAAESRIRDVDMAAEMMEFTKNNILTQASQAMLAQANQLPQGVLQLLQ